MRHNYIAPAVSARGTIVGRTLGNQSSQTKEQNLTGIVSNVTAPDTTGIAE